MEQTKRNIAIILAGGTGERFHATVPKQFTKLSGKMVIEHTIDAFENHPLIDEIYLVVNEEFYNLVETMCKNKPASKVKKILIGGNTRQESSKKGIFACDDSADKVLIHDAVRPFVSHEIITNILKALDDYVSIDVAIPTSDTIIKRSENNIIEDVPERKYLLRGQTPQGFRLSAIKQAHIMAEAEGFNSAFDDCSLMLKYKLGDTFIVKGSDFNIKITYPLDLDIADKIFQINNNNIPVLRKEQLVNRLRQKVVVVFGGTSGIGLELVNLSRDFGSDSYGFSRSTGTDVRDNTSIKRALEEVYGKHKRIDIIIGSSGVLRRGFIEQLEISDIIDQVSINLIGCMLVAKESIPYLKQSKGSLLFFSSSSYSRGRCEYAPYSASKAGLVNFVQGFAEEMSMYDVRVNVLNPERTNTPMRSKNFGQENPRELLSTKYVALAALKTAISNITGAIVDVRKVQEDNQGP
jgi:2-C-methyl-D-erythritol 4-phosphate cytidylyltransferase